MRLPRLRPDLSPFRDSRDLRLVVGGSFVSNLGAQATLVALPFQLYLLTRSALLVGLLGAAEVVPLVAMALLGGADRGSHGPPPAPAAQRRAGWSPPRAPWRSCP